MLNSKTVIIKPINSGFSLMKNRERRAEKNKSKLAATLRFEFFVAQKESSRQNFLNISVYGQSNCLTYTCKPIRNWQTSYPCS